MRRERVIIEELAAAGRLPANYVRRRLRHPHDCTPAIYFVIGGEGDVIARCMGCGRQKVQAMPEVSTPTPVAVPEPVAPEPERVPALSPYRCAAHPDEAVDRRGRGCKECGR